MHQDRFWPRAGGWLRASRDARVPLVVLGVPLNRSISLGRCDLAPGAIRQALNFYSTAELQSGRDLVDLGVCDLGDVVLSGQSEFGEQAAVRAALAEFDLGHQTVVFLGGDNGVTRPGVHALGLPLDRVGVITLDAHLDLRTLENGAHNGNPIRGLLEDGLPGEHVVQIGLQSFANSSAYWIDAKGAGLKGVHVREVHERGIERVMGEALKELQDRKVEAIYFDLDLDVADRAACPGCPGSRPGGLHPWQVRVAAAMAGSHPLVRAMDLVELDPERDHNQVTALLAAACLLEFASGVQGRA